MRNEILSGRSLKYWILPGVAAGFFAVTVSALAFGLSDDDYVYLATTQHLERYNEPILDISPKERSRLHNLIDDPQTANDPIARDKNVKDASKLKILDPACGSGSFLLGAYQYLLDWHRHQYEKGGPEKHKKVLYQGPEAGA